MQSLLFPLPLHVVIPPRSRRSMPIHLQAPVESPEPQPAVGFRERRLSPQQLEESFPRDEEQRACHEALDVSGATAGTVVRAPRDDGLYPKVGAGAEDMVGADVHCYPGHDDVEPQGLGAFLGNVEARLHVEGDRGE